MSFYTQIATNIGKSLLDGYGTFSIADAVLLQKWLLASPDTSLVNWKAEDFHKDNQINAIDFTLMKRQLLNTKA